MSGSALSPWSMSTPANAVKYSQELARSVNCPVEHKGFKKMVECLRNKKLEDILSNEPIGPTFLTTFGPTIDGIILPSDLIASMSSFDPINNGAGSGHSNRGEKILATHLSRECRESTGNILGASRKQYIGSVKGAQPFREHFDDFPKIDDHLSNI